MRRRGPWARSRSRSTAARTPQCADGEEARVTELATYVKGRADALAEEFRSDHGPIGDDRVLLLTAILIADELWESRDAVAAPAFNGAHVRVAR